MARNKNAITITLLANAGLIVEHAGTRILIDGLFARQGHPFSTLPTDMYDEMMRGEGLFAQADYLAFSHGHPDHYDPEAVAQYLQRNRVRGLFLPPDAGGCNAPAKEAARAQGAYVWESGLELGQAHAWELQSGLRLELLALPHMEMGAFSAYGQVDCSCILLEFDGRNLLFGGDCDALPPARFAPFTQTEIEAAFINPYFYHTARGRAALCNYIRPRHTFICHLPFAGEEDTLQLHALLRHDLRRAEGPAAVPLDGLCQRAVLA